jgi:archaemetzincin
MKGISFLAGKERSVDGNMVLPVIKPWRFTISSQKPRRLVRKIAAIFLVTFFSMAFEPPGPDVRREAIGDLAGLSPVLHRAFSADASEFEPIPKPGPHDWLAVHPERGQTFDQFTKSHPNRPTESRRLIYLQPLGEFDADRSPSIEKLREFAAAFFAMEVKALPTVSLDASKFTTRHNPNTGNLQILTGDVLDFLKSRVPADAFCVLAITMEDLYPEPSWNFVFGQASLRERVGVYSFARYDPVFYGEPRASGYETVLLRRSCKVLAHETSHMFGLAHCIYFNCLMNGSNHLAESDRRPLHLCPVCLRKLQRSVGFDVLERYSAVDRVVRANGFADEADWLSRRTKTVRGD